MNPEPIEFLYPVILSAATPAALERLLIDHGVPVRRIHEFQAERDRKQAQNAFGIRDRAEFDFADRYRVRHVITWQDLMPANVPIDKTVSELMRSEKRHWREAGVEIGESIVRTPVADAIVERLRESILAQGAAWIRLAPWPSHHDGVFNFRFDLDEPEIEDWRRVAGIVDSTGIEPGVTWFLSTMAALRAPESIALLSGRDVQSHGHWHHVHANDPSLNASNIDQADRFLQDRQFWPSGFAAPGGRIVPDLAERLSARGYRYLAGLAGPSGSIVRTSPEGLHRVDALPVCEGAFLEAGVASVDTIVAAYVAAASRALARGRPVFWFGHPDRRLGRKPVILEQLIQAARGFGRLWHVGLGRYSDWIHDRNRMRLEVRRSADDPAVIYSNWESHRHLSPLPAIWVESADARWVVECATQNGHASLDLTSDSCSPIPLNLPEPEHWPAVAAAGWRWALRGALDWERETPVKELRGGPPARRVKGWLRRATDSSWHARFKPLNWPDQDPARERAA